MIFFGSRFLRLVIGILFIGGCLIGPVSIAHADEDFSTPVQVTFGWYWDCAVYSGGSLKCWEPKSGSKPTEVSGLDNVASFSLDDSTTTLGGCAILKTAEVKCWGNNSYGQLGLGDWVNRNSPTLIPNLNQVKSLVRFGVLNSNTCALISDGTVKCWGYYLSGLTGPVSTSCPNNIGYCWLSNPTPTKVPGLTGVENLLICGDHFSVGGGVCATLSSGKTLVYGINGWSDAQVDLTQTQKIMNSASTACALLNSSQVTCWGSNGAGEMGDGTSASIGDNMRAPQIVPGLDNVKDLAAGWQTFCSVRSNGTVWCWGSGLSKTPRQIPELKNVQAIWGGGNHYCAITYLSQVLCWGNQGYGISPAFQKELSFLPGIQINEALSLDPYRESVTIASISNSDAVLGIQASFDGGITWGNAAYDSSKITLNGLRPATYYKVIVRAVMDYGVGLSSNPLTFFTASAPPSAPVASVLSTTKDQINVGILPPSDLNDIGPVTYQYSINSGTSWQSFSNPNGPFIISNLSANQSFEILVRAVNSAGSGEISLPVVGYTTSRVPVPPTITSLTPQDRGLVVAVAPPSDITSQSILSYDYQINDSRVWSRLQKVDGQYVISNLINGVTFSVKIRAINSNGASAESKRISGKPMTVSSQPVITSINSASGSLIVNFTDPIENGGSSISNYQFSLDGGNSWQACNPIVKKGPKITIKGLNNKQLYSVAMRAINSAGAGASSNLVIAAPVGPPGAIVGTILTVNRNSITVAFGTANDGGAPITNYSYSSNNKTWISSPTNNPVTITGLRPETVYAVYVRADNALGKGVVATITYKTLK